MLERTLLTAILVVLGVISWIAFNRLSVRRAARTILRNPDPLLVDLRQGVPVVLYFTTPTCAPCRTLQRPALTKLQNFLGTDKVQIVQVDATEQPDAADRWGVFSAPTTFILDKHHVPRQVNRGVASFETLTQQLTQVV